jgi:hypothetical protein
MDLAEQLYRQTCDAVARMPTPDLDPGMRKVWILIGALSDAFWRRQGEPGFSVLDHLQRNSQQYLAESADEVALWDELTAPENHLAVVRYVNYHRGRVSDYAANLHETILEASGRRYQGPAGPIPIESIESASPDLSTMLYKTGRLKSNPADGPGVTNVSAR